MTAGASGGGATGFDWYRLLPRYWFQNDPTDRQWDALLNEALDKYQPDPGSHTTTIGPLEVWTSNWPYAYGSLYGPVTAKLLPMVRTRKRLHALVGDTQHHNRKKAIWAARKLLTTRAQAQP